jgi:AcrR family transcriptional regulator
MPANPKSRPGGRSARVRAAVIEAVTSLLAEKDVSGIAMADIADRAGIATTSLYRRWGDLPALLMDVAVERLTAESPLPDTGSLSGDLGHWAKSVARSLQRGSPFYRILIATASPGEKTSSGRMAALTRRLGEIDEMLARGRSRGETVPEAMEVIDHVLAPLYWRMLAGIPALEEYGQTLADRLIRVTRQG